MTRTRTWTDLVVFMALAIGIACSRRGPERRVLPSLYPDRALFDPVLDRAKPYKVGGRLSGLIVPHHLLARDLAANAFATVASPEWKRVVILAPDHFHLGNSPISVVDADFETPFGTVRTEGAFVRALADVPGVTRSDAFYREHGFASLTPFIKRCLPNATVCAIAIRPNARREQLDGLINRLKSKLDADTLVVQSTDFSHYLTAPEAEIKDAESREVLLYGSPDLAFTLRQPEHTDSAAALYVQSRLQQEVFFSRPVVLDHLNSQHYAPRPVQKSTSYFIVGYETPRRADPEQRRDTTPSLLFTGDVMLGRTVATLLHQGGRDAPFQHLESLLRSSTAVIANLEGPMVSTPMRSGPLTFHFAPECAPRLAQAGFTHLGIANNHSLDQGLSGVRETREILRSVNLVPVGNPAWTAPLEVERLQVGSRAVLLLALNATEPYVPFTKIQQRLARMRFLNPAAFIVVSVHWGHEFSPRANTSQQILGRGFVDAGADLVVGHHPHVVQDIEAYRGRWIVYSLGNLVFDQWTRPEARSGLMLRLTFPESGSRCELLPVELGRARPHVCEGGQRQDLLEALSAISSAEAREGIRDGVLMARSQVTAPSAGHRDISN